MKLRIFASIIVALGVTSFATAADDENHKILEKVMKEGLKGDASPFGKVKAGTATADDYKTLYELVRTMRGTKAPVGDQAGYDEKVEAFIRAAGATNYADPTAHVAALKEAANCKSCHSEHKPD